MDTADSSARKRKNVSSSEVAEPFCCWAQSLGGGAEWSPDNDSNDQDHDDENDCRVIQIGHSACDNDWRVTQ